MPEQPSWHLFDGMPALAAALAESVAAHLATAIGERGEAFIAVSGGTTPAPFFRALSKLSLPWEKVTVTLIDERFVPPTSPRSNQALVAEMLLQDNASAARFVGLYREASGIAQAAALADEALGSLPWPLDVAVLGMGPDGHTASYFPDAADLDKLIDPQSKAVVLPVLAESAGEPRLTLSLPRICSARYVALHIEGETKRRIANAAQASRSRLPIGAVFENARQPVQIFWAP
jgi:6-phosphogluconolactonase